MFWYEFMPALINVSLTASVAIVLVMLLRLPLKRAPKVVSYALWGIVLFRLLCPVSIESDLSLYKLFDAPAEKSGELTSSIEYVPTDIVHTENPSVSLPLPGISDAINETLPQGREQTAADPLEAPVTFATYVLIAGVLAITVHGVASYIRLRPKITTAVPVRENILIADDIESPFVVGLLRPKIYLPSSLGEHERPYVILHEQHHIRRFDHITRALAFAALCIHWFNPLVWAAFTLSGKDMEMSCDEAVMRKMGPEIRADYSASLLGFATGRKLIAGAPLAFGEGDTRGRIENLARWKRPGAWIVAAAIVVCIVATLALATNPKTEAEPIFPGYYQVEEIIYKNAWYAELDFLDEEDLPQVNLSAAGLLLLSDGEEWLNAGVMEKTSLQKGNFDEYFYGVTYESSPAALRRSAAEAYLTITVPTATNGIAELAKVEGLGEHGQLIFYAFSTRDGSTYLACGSWDEEALSDPSSDESVFLWVARLAKMKRVVEWFDHYRDDNAAREIVDASITLEEFPGVTFYREPGSIRAESGGMVSSLFAGAPVWNAFFADLTGDGLPEICSTAGFEKGKEGDFVVIYDYANGVSYSLTDRENYSYSLSAQADKLVVEKRAVANGETVEEGYLAYVDETLTIIPGIVSNSLSNSLDEAISNAILEHYDNGKNDGLIYAEAHLLLANEAVGIPMAGQEDGVSETTAYLLVLHQKYSTSGGRLEARGGSYVPTAITFEVDEAGLIALKEYWEPRDGIYYVDDIRAKFPESSSDAALSDQDYIEHLKEECYANALAQFQSEGSVDQKISELLNKIVASTQGDSDSPHELAEAHREAYDELVGYGEFTLKYCFSQFLEGGQTDLRGEVMAAACQDIALSWGEAILMVDSDPPLNGQEWFDEFKAHAKRLAEQYSTEELEKMYPASWLLIQMTFYK